MIDTRDEPTLRGAGRTEGHVGRVRLPIADDHEVVRQGLRAFLDLDPALEVVGDAADGAQAVRPIKPRRSSVVMLAIHAGSTSTRWSMSVLAVR